MSQNDDDLSLDSYQKIARIEDRAHETEINEFNERIFKLIQTLLRKLESQSFLD